MMKKEHQEILKIIETYLEKNPEQRFTQALFNLDINQSHSSILWEGALRDNYGDKDSTVVVRVQDRLKELNNK